MLRSTSLAALLAVTACAVTPDAARQQRSGAQSSVPNTPLKVTLATATPGGGFPVYGAAFKAAIEETDPSIKIETINTKGSAENVPLLEQRKMDLALVQGEAAYEALAGVNRNGPADMKILW